MKIFFITIVFGFLVFSTSAQLLTQQKAYTRADTLRGSITPERAWWDLLHYDLHVAFNYRDSTITGHNIISYKVIKDAQRMQIDLMEPLVIDSILTGPTASGGATGLIARSGSTGLTARSGQTGERVEFKREGNAFFLQLKSPQALGTTQSITVFYHGKPKVAVRPPWDGGVIWARDKTGRGWISVACQGLGASVWYPCKDHQADEPDSASIHILAPDPLKAISNGRLVSSIAGPDHDEIYSWSVLSPINNYNLIPYIGNYVPFRQTYAGEKGPLSVTYWVLDYNLVQAQTHLRNDVVRTLKNLEYWFGPYPFREDGYQIVDAPHLGMEHQSAIAYGNGYQNGYLGHDLSRSGWGMKWDFIVVHESAHEWFGNNITTKDLADMWVHESFANYAETLFTTSEYGKEAGNDYVIGTRKNIRNDIPIIGKYNVNEEGSGDMYYKGGNMIHMIRQIINDDEKFRKILRGLNQDFYHKTVTTQEIENYISSKSGINFSKLFDQYLRTNQIPVLNYAPGKEGRKNFLVYFWSNCVDGFDMPVKVSLKTGKSIWLKPLQKVQKLKIKNANLPERIVDRNFYIGEQIIGQPEIQRN